MEIQQLRLLAARVRELLQQTQSPIGHSQSLDLASSLAGLRNWPEVLAFPGRLSPLQLDAAALRRLAVRLKHTHNLTFSPEQLRVVLDPTAKELPVRDSTAHPEALEFRPSGPQAGEHLTTSRAAINALLERNAHEFAVWRKHSTAHSDALEIWPSGPQAGVYLTNSKAAINALLERYARASERACIYAERAENHWEGSFYLGEKGLESSDLEGACSGTLIIVGPIDLEQSSWTDSARRLQQGCLLARFDRLRVAVLVNTPTPERLCEDAHLMVRSHPDSNGAEVGLMGVVSETGELLVRTPFAQPEPLRTRAQTHVPKTDTIPARALALLTPVLREARAGLVILDPPNGASMPPQVSSRQASGSRSMPGLPRASCRGRVRCLRSIGRCLR